MTLRVLQPASQDRLCPNQLVQYECRISEPSLFLFWQHSTVPANLLAFSVSSSVSASANTSDGKFTATLTEVMLDGIRATFASTLTVQPPLSDLNETELTCEGSTTEPVQDTITIILTGNVSTA